MTFRQELAATPLLNAVARCSRSARHVIWDWNGTLLDDVEHVVAVMNQLLDEHALPRIDRRRHGMLFDFPVRRYYDALGFDYVRESFESLCVRFMERFAAGVPELPIFPHMQAAVRALEVAGLEQSILSATEQATLEAMVSHYGLRPTFTHVFGTADRFAVSKLERGHELMRASGVDPEDTVLVGDTLHDVEVANALGTHLILVDHGHHSRERLHHARLVDASRRLEWLASEG